MFLTLGATAISTPVPTADPNTPLYLAAGIGAFGALVAGGLGVVGLFLVLRQEQGERRKTRLDDALANVMVAMADHSLELIAWLDTPTGGALSFPRRRFHDITGGPSDARMRAALDVAWMHASSKDERQIMDCTYMAVVDLRRGRTTWQASVLGEMVGTLRTWRQGAITSIECANTMLAIPVEANRQAREIKDKSNAEKPEAAPKAKSLTD